VSCGEVVEQAHGTKLTGADFVGEVVGEIFSGDIGRPAPGESIAVDDGVDIFHAAPAGGEKAGGQVAEICITAGGPAGEEEGKIGEFFPGRAEV
jgi:hypothetical protein